jgi:hypothetical protein
MSGPCSGILLRNHAHGINECPAECEQSDFVYSALLAKWRGGPGAAPGERP